MAPIKLKNNFILNFSLLKATKKFDKSHKKGKILKKIQSIIKLLLLSLANIFLKIKKKIAEKNKRIEIQFAKNWDSWIDKILTKKGKTIIQAIQKAQKI